MTNSRDKNSKKGAHLVKPTPKKTAPKPEKAKKRMPRVFGVLIAVLVAAAVGLCVFNQMYPNVFPGVTAGSIPVGGKSV